MAVGKNKHNFYKKCIKTNSLYYHEKFKCYRNKLNYLIKIRKSDYFKKYFINNKANIKNIWIGIKKYQT